MAVKRKVSLILDADLVDELEDLPDTALSSQVNEAIRVEVARRRRQRALGALVDRMTTEDGPLTATELEAVTSFEQQLGGR